MFTWNEATSCICLKYKYGNRHLCCQGYYVDFLGKNAKKNTGIYKESDTRRFRVWPNVVERVR